MSTKACALKEWLATIPDNAEVAIGDSGLILTVMDSEAMFELGGVPIDDETWGVVGNWPTGYY